MSVRSITDLQAHVTTDHTLKPTARTIDDLSENTLRYAKRVGGTYDHANIETSRYFQDLARQVRDHEAFLANEGKRAVKSGMSCIPCLQARRLESVLHSNRQTGAE